VTTGYRIESGMDIKHSEDWEDIMRRGCISLGGIRCNNCERVIAHSERYLAIDEDEKGNESEKGQTKHYCVQCSIDKGLARYKEEKDGRVLTFFS
jgi:hypothetical protein